jgi:hypothetical protein
VSIPDVARYCYRTEDAPNFASFAGAARAGHPDAMVAFNGRIDGARLHVLTFLGET